MEISEQCSVIVESVTALIVMATSWERKRMRQRQRIHWIVMVVAIIV
jgi:hypothetical protein